MNHSLACEMIVKVKFFSDKGMLPESMTQKVFLRTQRDKLSFVYLEVCLLSGPKGGHVC